MKKYNQINISTVIDHIVRCGVVTLLIVDGVMAEPSSYPVIGEVVRLDPGLDKIISPGAKIEVIGSGFE